MLEDLTRSLVRLEVSSSRVYHTVHTCVVSCQVISKKSTNVPRPR